MTVANKYTNVPDSVCNPPGGPPCPQFWEGECVAYCHAHSQAELKHRSSGRMNCYDGHVTDEVQEVEE